MKLQRGRIYSLIVGTEEDAVEINNLQIKFKVVKTSSNRDKKNSAYVEIYNLSEERRKALERQYVTVSLKVGYADTDLVTLFTGQVININTKKVQPILSERSGTDIITKLEIDELFETLNNTAKTKVVPAGKKVKDVIMEVIKDIPEITQREIKGQNVERGLPDGYSISGTPKQVLDNLSRDYNIEWQIDQGVLYVTDRDKSFTEDTGAVPKLGEMSGLIERPEYINEDVKRLRAIQKAKEKGKEPPKPKHPRPNALKFKILLNASIIAGSIVNIEFGDLTGYYKVDEVTHEGDFRGDTWHSTLICSEKIE